MGLLAGVLADVDLGEVTAGRGTIAGTRSWLRIRSDYWYPSAPFEARRPYNRPVGALRWFHRHVGRYLAGQSVELVCHDGLVEVFHDAVLVATPGRGT